VYVRGEERVSEKSEREMSGRWPAERVKRGTRVNFEMEGF